MNNIGFNSKAWGRTNSSPNMLNQNTLQPQLVNQSALGNMGPGMVQFQQPQHQVFQNAMGIQQQNIGLGLQQIANSTGMSAATLSSQIASNQLFQQVAYPNTRGLNPTAFQTNVPPVSQVQNNTGNSGAKQRVFTGKVTHIHDNFGLVDEEVIFQMNACVKGSNPVVGDRVLVEASYTPNMHFKWNATRIQVLSMKNQTSSRHSGNSNNLSSSSTYNAVPPPSENSNFGRTTRQKGLGGRGRERSREKERDDDEIERKRRREDRLREREKEDKKSPVRRRSRSPKARRRSRIVPRYMVQIPKIALDLSGGDVLEVRRRYSNLYIPSDFFFTNIRWVDSFPPDKSFTLNKPCSFHIMNKEIDPVVENSAILEPPDANYIFSAKVMLMSVPGMEDLYQKCCALAEEKDRRDRDSEERDYVHPTRLINFLVGLRGKNETMAIGGPWSPSLDGQHPEKDPSVLIKTAIRTCKALTGIDLSNCTQWYRFVELYYRRAESVHKGKQVPARVETVVLFLPDVWSCLPTRLEWDHTQHTYRKRLESILSSSGAGSTVDPAEAAQGDSGATSTDEKEDTIPAKLEPTHYSQLDPKTMPVNDLRNELKARNITHKGLKSQLVARLSKALKAEAEKGNDEEGKEKESDVEVDTDSTQDTKKTENESKKLDEREKALLEKRYTLPEQQHILVHPSKTAKSGKFDCTVMSLSLLLDYRPEDTKEHSFEVSLFAELFNEMLIRDFGFNIYKALYELPEKPKEEKKEKDEKRDKDRDDKKKDEDIEKKKEEEKKKDTEKKKDESEKNRDSKEKSDGKEEEKKKDSSRRSDDSEEDDDDDNDEKDRKKDKDKRKKERVKLYTKDKQLLLSFIYFDQTHCGYIFDKDIEDLLYTLGLKLSRAQIRKLVSKVITRDSLHYRKLTDKPKDDEGAINSIISVEVNVQELACGNKRLLPIFQENNSAKKSKSEGQTEQGDVGEGLVLFQGCLVDVGKLMSQMERSEKARLDTEARMVDLKTENQKLLDKCNKSHSTIKHLNSEVREYKDRLRNTEESLSRVSAHSKLFQATLVDIREKIDPVLRSTAHKDDVKKEERDKDKKHEDSKSRWEKEKDKEKEKEREREREKERDKEKDDVEVKGIRKEKEENMDVETMEVK